MICERQRRNDGPSGKQWSPPNAVRRKILKESITYKQMGDSSLPFRTVRHGRHRYLFGSPRVLPAAFRESESDTAASLHTASSVARLYDPSRMGCHVLSGLKRSIF